MIGHRSCFRENDDLLLRRGPDVKKKPPFSNARALIARKIMRSRDAQCNTGDYNIARALVLSNSHCVIMNQISMDARPCSIKVLHKMTCAIHFSCKISVAFSASSFA